MLQVLLATRVFNTEVEIVTNCVIEKVETDVEKEISSFSDQRFQV